MILTKLLLLPLFMHVLLIFFVGIRSLRARIKAVKSGSAKLHEIATDSGAWPARVKKHGDNFDNQFETPMLWYSACALIVALKLEDTVFAALSWMFLLTRLAHSYVQTTHNNVPSRMRIFLLGFFTLIVMWTWLAMKLFLLG
jgi:hypothetical protein